MPRRIFVLLPNWSNGGNSSTLASSMSCMPWSANFSSKASSTPLACPPYLPNTSRFFTLLARSRRVSGFWSKAKWVTRSNASSSLPFTTACCRSSNGTPCFSNSSSTACLRSAQLQRRRKSVRLPNFSCKAFLRSHLSKAR
ncbi:hypothetical protein D3C79_883210 [compost metagenome]